MAGPTPLHRLDRISRQLHREIWIKRDDLTPLGGGGNKVRKLEFLMAQALAEGSDVVVTGGAIQSNHVRQTAAAAARVGLRSHVLLTNPGGVQTPNFLNNGNRLLIGLFGAHIDLVPDGMTTDTALAEAVKTLRATARRPYAIPPGGSSAIGTLGYVLGGLELASQLTNAGLQRPVVITASGSGGTQVGLTLALRHALPESRVIGVTVSRKWVEQQAKLLNLLGKTTGLLAEAPIPASSIQLWDRYFGPRYGLPSDLSTHAIEYVAAQEGLLLDPVYTGKAFGGLMDAIKQGLIDDRRPIIFIHTGGAPANFAFAH
ncbi:D-cysteine desulfhydrase family protein [Achromobacter marplatensis]|uniref:D-cysteine desulfhydrase family protein n=1 Tax=Achromobacter marplatensis TaxID=470868 RepID=UPI0028EA3AAC|nr:D-cysteine desulfhydrase family protein [Achromobacter marplatensis]